MPKGYHNAAGGLGEAGGAVSLPVCLGQSPSMSSSVYLSYESHFSLK